MPFATNLNAHFYHSNDSIAVMVTSRQTNAGRKDRAIDSMRLFFSPVSRKNEAPPLLSKGIKHHQSSPRPMASVKLYDLLVALKNKQVLEKKRNQQPSSSKRQTFSHF
jgi:hypothetical protein